MTIRSGLAPRAAQSIDPASLSATIDLLRHRAGLLIPVSQHKALETAMLRLMRESRLPDAPALTTLLADDVAVFDDLAADVTIGETYFFRESAQFELIRNVILPRLLEPHRERRIRAWSAACASGEEAYSLAITLIEQQVNGDVIGTDISRLRLSVAGEGVYRSWSLRGVKRATIDRWFEHGGDRFTLDRSVRERVSFGYLNLADASYPALSAGVWGMDLILCRNVLIYFDPPTVERVSRALLASLSDDGWLLLGAADPPLTAAMGADVIQTEAGLVYRRLRPGSGQRAEPVHVVIAIDSPQGSAPDVDPSFAVLPLIDESAPSSMGMSPALLEESAVPLDTIQAAYARRDHENVVALVEAEMTSSRLSTTHRVLLVRALANLGRLSDALRACASALDVQRDVAELHYLHSVLLMESGRPADAMLAAKRALYLDRDMIVAQLAAATAAARSGHPAAASRALAAAERLLGALPPDLMVAASDGNTAGRLLEMTRVQRRLLPA